MLEEFNILKKAKYGKILFNKNDKYIGRSIEEYGEFSELEALMFKQICKRDDVVIEVGANIGTHTQIFSQLVGDNGKVFAYEPQRIIFQTLNANIALNSFTNVYTYQNAVGKEKKDIYIPILNYKKQNNFGGISVKGHEKGELIKQIKLDSLSDKINSLKLIKIDVEGMESEVILGAKELIHKYKPFLYVENDRQEKSKELIDLIKSMDYRLYWHLPSLYNQDNFYKNSNNIFGNIVSVNMLCIHNSNKIKVDKMIEVTDSNFHPMKRITNGTK